MNVHNLMEDLVIQNVNEMYEQVKEAKARDHRKIGKEMRLFMELPAVEKNNS